MHLPIVYLSPWPTYSCTVCFGGHRHRHPNYFGDACVWWGVWLAGGLASGWLPALATLVAPVAMTYFLAYATGARLLERTMMQRPGYPAYAARTSMFVPWLPRR